MTLLLNFCFVSPFSSFYTVLSIFMKSVRKHSSKYLFGSIQSPANSFKNIFTLNDQSLLNVYFDAFSIFLPSNLRPYPNKY